MALFGFGKKGEEKAKDEAAKGEPGKPVFSPEKARSFFEQARVKQEVGSYDYALNLWLNGLRLDPNNLAAVQAFFSCASQSGVKEPTRDLKQITDGSTPVHKVLAAWLAWAFRPLDADAAIRAAMEPAALGLSEPGRWIAPKALEVLYRAERPRKSQYIDLMRTFITLEQFDLAVKAGEGAIKMDPGDVPLTNDVRNLAATATMTKGGYENSGQEGGFRSNIRDAEKQRRLEESERLAKGESALDRGVETAKAEYEARPTDKPTIRRYIEALVARKQPHDIEGAIAVATKAFADTQEYQFRALAGDIQVKVGRARLKALKATAEANPGDAGARRAFVEAEAKQLALEINELEASCRAYPTDMTKRFELGQRYLLAGRHADAIGQFQSSKNDGRLKAASLTFLAQAFTAMDWNDEAIETYRQAIEGHQDLADENGMALRYGLMTCLLTRAGESKDVASAEEAEKLASAIAMQQFQYRDIQAQRTSAKQLVQKLKSGG